MSTTRQRWGCKEAMRRSGLTRAQLRYAEERQHLGTVARAADGRRLYEPEQLRWLELLGGLRELGLALDDAAGIASAICGNSGDWSRQRAEHVLTRAFVEVQRRTLLARELCALLLQVRGSSSDAATAASGRGHVRDDSSSS